MFAARRITWRLALAIVLVPLFAAAVFPAPIANTDSRTVAQAVRTTAMPAAAEGLKTSHWVDGTSRIKKLNSEITIGRGRFDGSVTIGDPGRVSGDLAIPPSPSYFVTFGFMPVTGVVEMVQDRPADGTTTVKMQNGDAIADVDATVHVLIRLRDVKVDRKPLDVGPACRTAQPVDINIKGTLVLRNDPNGVPPTKVRSVYTVPKFTGCGATEDLNPMMTGLVSGPGNILDTVLTLRCFRDQNCPPDGERS